MPQVARAHMRHSFNIASAYAVYILRTVAPIVVIPHVASTLSSPLVAAAFSVLSLSLLGAAFVEYGFGVWGIRELSSTLNENSRDKTISVVLSAQILLSLFAVPIVGILSLLSPFTTMDVVSALFCSIGTIMFGLSPNWIWFGIKRPTVATGIEAIGVFFSVFGIVFFVHSDSDFYLLIFLQLLQVSVPTVVGWMIIVARFGQPSLRFASAIEGIVDCFLLFQIRFSVVLYTNASPWLAGFLLSADQAAAFGFANRFFTPLVGLFAPLSNVLFPVINSKRAAGGSPTLRPAAYIACIFFAVSLGVYLAALFFGAEIFAFIFPRLPKMYADSSVFMTVLLLPISISQAFGVYFILVERQEIVNVIAFGLGLIVFFSVAYLASGPFGASGVIMARFACEVGVTLVMVVGAARYVRRF
jgi:O-antigen/teichoic acid export membrane protein